MLKSISTWFHNRPRIRLAALLVAPLFWLVVAYLGALGSLLVTSFYTINTFTGDVIRKFNLGNFEELVTNPSYRNVIVRTLGIALSVTIICTVLALPMAFFMAKIAQPRTQKILVALVLTPLWASYLVKISHGARC